MRIYLLAFILASACLHLHAVGHSQISIQKKQIKLPALFSEIEKQTGYSFFYNNAELEHIGKIDVAVSGATMEAVLSQIFSGLPIGYEIINKTVVVNRKNHIASKEASERVAPLPRLIAEITGVVTDTLGLPLKGATVTVLPAGRSVVTDEKGIFMLGNVPEGSKIRISFVGYEDKELIVSGNGHFIIVLLTKTQALDKVTVNAGIIRRNRETFTGATATFSGDELRRIGNQNVFQSLKALDPSFVILENNSMGANPSLLPAIELRGKTSITTTQLNDQFALDPNQPLFVLNGFETTLEKIFNLDINRVASITILKDAASTAIYGSRAANGVIVVETIAPVPGELRFSYSGGVNVNIPDLRSYNLMDAAEKLEFERLSGRYSTSVMGTSYDLTALYNARLAEVKRGVNTYWLNEPVRTGISDNHSLLVSGGTEEFAFSVQGTMRNNRGVMKGSENPGWGGSIDITYRRGKLNISNGLYLSGSHAKESPYGSFATFAQANPYYRRYTDDGTIPRFLDSVSIRSALNWVPNPLYNASLNNINERRQFDVQNNLRGIWDFTPNLRLSAGLQLLKNSRNAIVFTPPEHTSFNQADVLLKGTYTNNRVESESYDLNAALTYHRVLNVHSLQANLRGRLSEDAQRITGFSATGFPFGTNGNPAYAFGYSPYQTPNAASLISRQANFFGSVNYAFDQRYMVDATYSLDGSTNFGSNKQFKPFWSAGIGWNLHHENWFHAPWLTLLRLRTSIGSTGNQRLGAYGSTSVYQFIAQANQFGQSLDLKSIGNSNLDWQSSFDQSFGAEFGLFSDRVSGYLNYYIKTTDPLLVNATDVFPPSIGIESSYPVNVGKLTTKGWEAQVSARVFSIPEKRLSWMVMINGAFAGKSVYGNFGDALKTLNEAQLNSKGLIRYLDGYSPNDIWTVVSGGIDPATGREIFQTKEGSYTFTYNTDHIVRVGNTQPTAKGIIGTTVTYEAFSLSLNASYQFGASRYNSTLFDKVENISAWTLLGNQDRRALYDRWQQPGDVARFRRIDMLSWGAYAPVTSRFIQQDNYLHFNSVSFNWLLDRKGWLKRAHIRSMRIGMTLNDVLRFENILLERGTDYPFQRTGSLTLSLNF